MRIDLKKIKKECSTCRSGSCCQEGVEISKGEMQRIKDFNPKVRKPWFRKVAKIYEPEPGFEFETVMRDGRCVFQAEDKRCFIYRLRPFYCRQFPLENGKLAEFYELLCDKACSYIKKTKNKG